VSFLDRVTAVFRPDPKPSAPVRQEKAGLTASDYYGPNGSSGGGYATVTGSKFPGGMGNYKSAYALDHVALRDRSRMAYWESTQARALLGRKRENVIGTGLSPQSSPIWEFINKDDPEDEEIQCARHEWKRSTDARFMLWANSHEPDSAGKRNLWEKQQLEQMARMLDGEVFLVLRYDDNPRRMSPLKIQSYTPDQIIQPTGASEIEVAKAKGNTIQHGIEMTADGEEVAIYVRDMAPTFNSPQFETVYPLGYSSHTTRIPYFGDSGRRFVIHSMNAENEQQIRGTPLLAGVLHELRKITDATVAELEAMVVNALFAMWVKPGPDANASRITQGMTKAGTGQGPGITNAPGIVVQGLKASEELQSFDTKRPNLNAQEFIRGVMKGVSSSMSTPISVAEMEHNASYSAARGALLQFWTGVEIERENAVSQVWNLVREAWFTEEVMANRIKAPGFKGKSAVIRAAWLNCGWLGSQMPSLDAEKDARAADLRINQGALTREKNAMQFNNSDFTENVARLAIENEDLAEANAPMNPAKGGQLALGLPEPGAEMPEKEQGTDPSSPDYQPKMDPNAPEYDPNYTPEAA